MTILCFNQFFYSLIYDMIMVVVCELIADVAEKVPHLALQDLQPGHLQALPH